MARMEMRITGVGNGSHTGTKMSRKGRAGRRRRLLLLRLTRHDWLHRIVPLVSLKRYFSERASYLQSFIKSLNTWSQVTRAVMYTRKGITNTIVMENSCIFFF